MKYFISTYRNSPKIVIKKKKKKIVLWRDKKKLELIE